MKTCEAVREDLSAWLDGELEPERKAETLAHAETCEECRSFLETCRLVSEDLRNQAPPVPDTLIPGVMARLSGERQTALPEAGAGRKADRGKYRRIAAWACAAAVLALVVFAGPWNWRAGSAGPKADMYAADSAAPAMAEAEEAPEETAAESAEANGWSGEEEKSTVDDGTAPDAASSDMWDSAADEAARSEAVPEEDMDGPAPLPDAAGALAEEYAAVITVWGGMPDGVLELAEGQETLPDGTAAWRIPEARTEELEQALSAAGAYEWRTGAGQGSGWLLVLDGEG
ncbi:MAG: zf-HC2 domain-containing protein [Oscillospiraceae bacterium]|nr:zf-HC2 domain-containing protein [Oscillospiraceae bacterium]